jgi:hypothetical protein
MEAAYRAGRPLDHDERQGRPDPAAAYVRGRLRFVQAVEECSSSVPRCQVGVGQVGAGPNASFQRGWAMKQGRSGSGSVAGADWAAKVVAMAAKLVAAAMAVMRRNEVVVVLMVVSSGCRADGPVSLLLGPPELARQGPG